MISSNNMVRSIMVKNSIIGCTGFNIKHSCVESLMGPLIPFIPLVTSFMLFFCLGWGGEIHIKLKGMIIKDF